MALRHSATRTFRLSCRAAKQKVAVRAPGEPLRPTQGSEGAIVPLPFPTPPRPYAQGDIPFSWEARYEAPDRWGKHGTR